jgi:hypothetical protein
VTDSERKAAARQRRAERRKRRVEKIAELAEAARDPERRAASLAELQRWVARWGKGR